VVSGKNAGGGLHGDAATVVLVRDAAGGLEVLLLERLRHRGSFAGAWVFPGGHVDPGDRDRAPEGSAGQAAATGGDGAAGSSAGQAVPGDGGGAGAQPGGAIDGHDDDAALLAAARRAGARETLEETGLLVEPTALEPLSLWIPPPAAPKRLRTWFFLAPASLGAVRLSAHEHLDHLWIAPRAALERHAAAGMELVPPTWITLHWLSNHASVAQALAAARTHGPETFSSQPRVDASGARIITWSGDEDHEPSTPAPAAGSRHRLLIEALPWVYERRP
jgi:8-oxo-dGTP pyrophosphatase MutT (NUDIX family)